MGNKLTLQLLVTYSIRQNGVGCVVVTKLTLRSWLLKKKKKFQARLMFVSLL